MLTEQLYFIYYLQKYMKKRLKKDSRDVAEAHIMFVAEISYLKYF